MRKEDLRITWISKGWKTKKPSKDKERRLKNTVNYWKSTREKRKSSKKWWTKSSSSSQGWLRRKSCRLREW